MVSSTLQKFLNFIFLRGSLLENYQSVSQLFVFLFKSNQKIINLIVKKPFHHSNIYFLYQLEINIKWGFFIKSFSSFSVKSLMEKRVFSLINESVMNWMNWGKTVSLFEENLMEIFRKLCVLQIFLMVGFKEFARRRVSTRNSLLEKRKF